MKITKQQKWTKEQLLICAIICSITNKMFMILRIELENIKTNKVNLFSNVFKIKLAD